ncbi:hypothetical protein PLUTE_a6003 [Pseudoalteromonas luteoviolacea DSM 6061]|nr:hypothetical protein [Pseudoalteromonas luteoviolacea DSM 6061]
MSFDTFSGLIQILFFIEHAVYHNATEGYNPALQ